MSNELSAKRLAKDSVFSDLFSDRRYLFELYQALHPEDLEARESDIVLMTLKSVVAEHIHNDLGFRVGNRLMILVEAQSKWSPNIVLRALGYLVQSYVDYCSELGLSLYDNVSIDLPIPELYVIYTGSRKNKPRQLSLSKVFFGGKRCCVDAKVRVIYSGKRNSIIYQYIMFCKVFDQQLRLCGKNIEAVEETIRICKSRNILNTYLKTRERELMKIMTVLFDQETVTKQLIASKERRAREMGEKKGGRLATLNNIKNLMQSLDMDIHKALDALKVPVNEREYYIKQIEDKK